ncbi:MAG: hypothetical protein WDM96_01430 [Lacunisphaera sp.]
MQNNRVLLPSHTLVFRVHTRVFQTLFVALAVAATFLAQLIHVLN